MATQREGHFPQGFFSPAFDRKSAQSSCNTAAFTPLSHHRRYLTVPSPLRHQPYNKHHYCEFIASLYGRGGPHTVSLVYQRWEQRRFHTGRPVLGGWQHKVALHTRAAALQHAVGAQPGACCNTTGIPSHPFPIPWSELDTEELLLSGSAVLQGDREGSSNPQTSNA